MKRVEPWATLLYYRYQREHFYFLLFMESDGFFSRAFSEFIDLVNLINSLNLFGIVLREN